MVAHELCRERIAVYTSEGRSEKSSLVKNWPKVKRGRRYPARQDSSQWRWCRINGLEVVQDQWFGGGAGSMVWRWCRINGLEVEGAEQLSLTTPQHIPISRILPSNPFASTSNLKTPPTRIHPKP